MDKVNRYFLEISKMNEKGLDFKLPSEIKIILQEKRNFLKTLKNLGMKIYLKNWLIRGLVGIQIRHGCF